ncbi:fimbrial protein [Acinetobacter bereziniae]|uniref:fimbrial protein n=2 Tax=Acinetobacter bereziniae TaxID=106648 RepID=UPI003009C690
MIRLYIHILFIIFGSLFALTAHATCQTTGVSQTEDNRTAGITFGKVNLTSTYLQPVGSLIDRVVVPSTNYNFGGATASSVLWICDKTDLSNIYFLVATNGDDGAGGRDEIGTINGLPNVFATYFKYVGLKLIMQGIEINRRYQAVPVNSYAEVGNKIHTRLMDIPPLTAELYRVSSLMQTSSWCAQIDTGNYSPCIQPNAYIQLKGPGLVSDNVGEDSNTNYRFWGADNGFGYGMRVGNTLTNQPTCVARNATPIVFFNTISTAGLDANQSVQENFNVAIECSNQVNSGTGNNQTAIGIQTSYGAFVAAQQLGLVNAQNGVAALLSDNYADAQSAKGVGIFLKNANTGTDMNFVGQPGLSGGGTVAGWYPALSGAQAAGSTESGYTHYLHNFTAILKKLPGTEPIKAGKVNSTAYVLVKVQ